MNPKNRKFLVLFSILLGFFISIRYLLPLIFPFLLGAALALAAEPMVRFGCKQLHLSRAAAAGIGLGMSFAFLTVVILMLAALLVRELGALAQILPNLEDSIQSGMDALSGWLLQLADQAPSGIATVLRRNITDFFSGSSALLDKATSFLLHFASGFLSRVPGRALSLGTGIISSFMISSKLPKIKKFFHSRVPISRLQPLLDTLSQLKRTLGGWLKAQCKLSGITFSVATAGLLLLHVPYAPLWAGLIAVVDIFPILGTGTVLIPWSLVAFLQGDRLLAFGLLALYAAAAVTRTVLEPRLVGRHLGIDPLITLLSLYVGFKLFGLIGMILAPMLAVTATQLMGLKTDG